MEENTSAFYARHDTATIIHALSSRLAKQCRELIQGGFREEEWFDIDTAFYQTIITGFTEFHSGTRSRAVGQLTHQN